MGPSMVKWAAATAPFEGLPLTRIDADAVRLDPTSPHRGEVKARLRPMEGSPRRRAYSPRDSMRTEPPRHLSPVGRGREPGVKPASG